MKSYVYKALETAGQAMIQNMAPSEYIEAIQWLIEFTQGAYGKPKEFDEVLQELLGRIERRLQTGSW